jgi:diguanylate cyclase (GGDEF)-like protein
MPTPRAEPDAATPTLAGAAAGAVVAVPFEAPGRFPPLEHFFRRPDGLASGRRSGIKPAHFIGRARRDPQILLAFALAIPIIAMEAISGMAPRPEAVAAPIAFLVLQLGLTGVRAPSRWLPSARLLLSLAFVFIGNALVDHTGSWPLTALEVPVIALAGALGGRATLLAAVGIGATLVPFVAPGVADNVRRESIAIAMAGLVIAIGSRRVVRSMEHSAERLRRANARDRRRARQLAALETVGEILAREGPTSATLDRVMAVLEATFGYRYPSVYTWDGALLHLGAQRHYEFPIESFRPDVGVIGRVARTLEPAFLPDARSDPDFEAADPNVTGEISVPLLSGGELLGILNVESDRSRQLDRDDFATMLLVGDRLAAALALGRERQKLTERSALLERLTKVDANLNSILDVDGIHERIASGAADVIPSHMNVIVLEDPASGEYRTVAVAGGDPRMLGARILPGEGISGRAIATGALAVDDRFERSSFPQTTVKARLADVLTAMSAPLISAGHVTGALTWLREGTDRPFTVQEQEIAVLLASRVVPMLANAALHQAAQEAAITDALTGIHNRRHFDASMATADALRERHAPADRRERSAILFDLDHFGAVNKRHGHQVGDRILRAFADVLRTRVRASDLVARYGGEEFVVIMDGATRDDAVRLADEVRLAFRQGSIDGADDGTSITTVSAGCASLDRTEVSGTLLLERADVGLAMAKAGGRDQVVAA